MSEACTLQSIGADRLNAPTDNRLFLREEKKLKREGGRRETEKEKGEKEEKGRRREKKVLFK